MESIKRQRGEVEVVGMEAGCGRRMIDGVSFRYGEQLKLARNEGFKKGFFSSLVIGGLYLVIFSTYALGFW